jgi:Imidazolonepropionase and related amidohydrolases
VKRSLILHTFLLAVFSPSFFLSTIWAQSPVPQPSKEEPVTVIIAGTLIDGVSASPSRDRLIFIRGNKISDVGAAGATLVPTNLPAGSAVIDLSHSTVLPGLIDAHTHIFLQGEDPAAGGYDIQLLKYPLAFRAARATVSVRRALEQGLHDSS